ncbi:hypothetical protein WJX82_008026 [Trebouxia sp. C0006]
MHAGYCAHCKRSWSNKSKDLASRPHRRQKVRHPEGHQVALRVYTVQGRLHSNGFNQGFGLPTNSAWPLGRP